MIPEIERITNSFIKFIDSYGDAYYFSYNTLVGYRIGFELMCRINEWGPTTGKHLNHIDTDHTHRVSKDVFETHLRTMMRCRDADN